MSANFYSCLTYCSDARFSISSAFFIYCILRCLLCRLASISNNNIGCRRYGLWLLGSFRMRRSNPFLYFLGEYLVHQRKLNLRYPRSLSTGYNSSFFTMSRVVSKVPDEVDCLILLNYFLYQIAEIGAVLVGSIFLIFFSYFRYLLVWDSRQGISGAITRRVILSPQLIILLYLMISTNGLIIGGVFSDILIQFPIYFIDILYRSPFWVISFLVIIVPYGVSTVSSVVGLLTPSPLCCGRRRLRRWACYLILLLDMRSCSRLSSYRCPWAAIWFDISYKWVQWIVELLLLIWQYSRFDEVLCARRQSESSASHHLLFVK